MQSTPGNSCSRFLERLDVFRLSRLLLASFALGDDIGWFESQWVSDVDATVKANPALGDLDGETLQKFNRMVGKLHWYISDGVRGAEHPDRELRSSVYSIRVIGENRYGGQSVLGTRSGNNYGDPENAPIPVVAEIFGAKSGFKRHHVNRNQLKTKILMAFECIPRPDHDQIAPHQCDEYDRLADDLVAKHPVSDLPEDLLDIHCWDLPLFSAEAKRYLLPAWMIRSIEDVQTDFRIPLLAAWTVIIGSVPLTSGSTAAILDNLDFLWSASDEIEQAGIENARRCWR